MYNSLKITFLAISRLCTELPHTGFQPTSRYTLLEAIHYLSHLLNLGKLKPEHGKEKQNRNAQILALYKEGHSLTELAQRFNISEQRVHQIILRDRS